MGVDLKNIAEGWAKHIGLTDVPGDLQELAKKRVDICVECPDAKEQWLTKFIDGILKKDIKGSGIGCGICHCPVNQKALVREEKCSLNKW